MPFFLNPFAFAGLAAIPVLIGIYYLRNRFKRRVVSSLILWDGIVKSNEGGQKRDRLQLPWMFFLELLGLLALAFAATQPFFKTTSNRIPITIVLDDSFSMLAISPDDEATTTKISVRDRVVETLSEMAKSNTYEFDIIAAGQKPKRLSEENITDSAALTSTLERWTCQQSSSNLFDAMEMVKKVHGAEHRILVCTDQPPENQDVVESDSRLKWISFGKPIENTAITFASRKRVLSDEGEGEKLLVRIENFSGNPKQATKSTANSSIKIVDTESESTVVASNFQLASDSKKEIVLDLPESVAKKNLRIEIDSDAVAADNELFLLAEKTIEIDVYLNLDDAGYEKIWMDALQVIPNVKINQSVPSDCDIVITDTEFVLQPEQWHIYCPPQLRPVPFAGPYAVSMEHPLANGLPIRGAIWAADASKNETMKIEPDSKSDLKNEEKNQPKPNESQKPKTSPSKNEPPKSANDDKDSEPSDENKSSNQPDDSNSPKNESDERKKSDSASEATAKSTRDTRSRSVIRTGQTDLVIDQQLSQLRRRIQLNLQPKYSTVSSSLPTWIVLVVNMIDWRKKFVHGPEFVNTWQSTQKLRFPLEAETITLTRPDEQTDEVPVINGMVQIDMQQSGVWSAKIESSGTSPKMKTGQTSSKSTSENNETESNQDPSSETNSEENVQTTKPQSEWKWSFYPLSARESDLQNAETVTIDNWRELDVKFRSFYQPTAWLFGLLAFSLLVIACLFQRQT